MRINRIRNEIVFIQLLQYQLSCLALNLVKTNVWLHQANAPNPTIFLLSLE